MKKLISLNIIRDFIFILIVSVLIASVLNTSYLLLSNSFVQNIKINKRIGNNLSFNYVSNFSSIHKIDEPRILTDFKGKRQLTEYYDFDISIPEDMIILDEVEYEVILKVLSDNIDERFIKVYLTDQNNISYSGFEDVVPVYNVFDNNFDGKILYVGSFNKDNLNDKYRLKVWVSEEYKGNVSGKIVCQVSTKLR